MTDGLDARPEGSGEASGVEAAEEPVPERESEQESEPGPGLLRAAFEWVVVAVCALVLALVLQAFLVQAFSIPSGSMEPTLSIGDRVVVYKLGYRLHDVNRGDVVVFRNPDPSPGTDDLIKRVVALGGETFELRDGRVYIDGRPLEEPYLKSAGSSFPKQPIPGCDNTPVSDLCRVPEGRLLVLGDNRDASRDGRFFGPVDVDSVVGRAFMKYWPPNDIGGI